MLNGVWLGRAEAGTFLKLRGEGGKWEDPMFSSDNGVTPLTLPLPLTLTLTLTPTPTLTLTLAPNPNQTLTLTLSLTRRDPVHPTLVGRI